MIKEGKLDAIPSASSVNHPPKADFNKYDLNSHKVAIVDDIDRGQGSEEGRVSPSAHGEFVEVTSKKSLKERQRKEKEEQKRQEEERRIRRNVSRFPLVVVLLVQIGPTRRPLVTTSLSPPGLADRLALYPLERGSNGMWTIQHFSHTSQPSVLPPGHT